ncbi:MAG: GTPase Obg [Parcubacteria group bacterium]|nr:GTPase Obg [Parcubacteria group bacterium]
MALIDQITLHATAGRGGDGVIRWLHIKGTEKGGPAGGDGGRGGDIIIEGVRDLGVLAQYRFNKKFRAEHGFPGEQNNRHGADGKDVVIKVPVGTLAKNTTTKEVVEILEEGHREVIFKGGPGGFGNAHYKSSINQNPYEASKGKNGAAGDIEISLKLIADVGLIGFPNAGKSSLLNELTNARSKVANYAFTTLDPHLGDFYGYIIADLPGIIEGASTGKGLGSRFLKHIERTKFLVHLVSADQDDLAGAYRAIRNELESFGRGLAEKPELVVLSKIDLLEPAALKAALATLKEVVGKEVQPLSILDPDLVKGLSDRLASELKP